MFTRFTFWSNSTSSYNILKFVTNAKESWPTIRITILLFHTQSQTVIWNSAFSAALLYNKRAKVTFFKSNWKYKMLRLSITFFEDRVPGQIPLLHDSVAFASPSHGAPPKSASVSLTLWFSRTPLPHVSEQSPICHCAHWQSTEGYFELMLIMLFKEMLK